MNGNFGEGFPTRASPKQAANQYIRPASKNLHLLGCYGFSAADLLEDDNAENDAHKDEAVRVLS